MVSKLYNAWLSDQTLQRPLSPSLCQGAELTRQNIPLQQAFQAGMEPLLGVERPKRDSARPQSVLDREDAERREELPSTGAEREEEERLDAGIGEHGAFGSLQQPETKNRRAAGIERTVWEFRSEEMMQAEKAAEAKAAAGKVTAAEKIVAEQDAAPETPEHAHAKAVEDAERPAMAKPAKTVKTEKSKFRFVDTSKR